VSSWLRVTEDDMAAQQLRSLRVTLLFTYSGIADARVEPVAKSNVTLTSLATACRAGNRTKVILYWRPIVPGWNDDTATMARVLDAGRAADAIVFTGYYHKQENADYLRSLGVEVPYGDDFDRRKVMPAEIDEKVIAAWRASGATAPLFRKTSCGVCFAHGVPDYNGHWDVSELCDICPQAQRALCRDAHRPPAAGQVKRILTSSGTTRRRWWTAGTCGRTASPSSSATRSSTSWDSRYGTWTCRTSRTRTAAPCSATSRTRGNGPTWQRRGNG